MRNTSAALKKVCQILLLLEALRMQRNDLKPKPLRSFLGSGGPTRRKLRRPSAFARLQKELDVPAKTDPLDLVAFALSLAPDLLPRDDPDTGVSAVETSIRRFQTEGFDLFEVPIVPPGVVPLTQVVPFTGPTPPQRGVVGLLKGLFTNEAFREAACGVVAPILAPATLLVRSPETRSRLVGLGALAALSGCGFEILETE